ncbi:MAG: serine protease [Kiritimatiellaceae bacterium]|nr:serine protease [Kiritimatiellaceae bacterium]
MQFFKKIVIGWVLFFTVCGVVHADTVSKLEETGRAFKSIAKEALPAVVFIDVESTVEVPPSHFEHPFFEQFFGRGWQGDSRQREYSQQGQGSGFIISKEGYILTNSHVVNKADRITVTLGDGRKFKATLVGADPKSEVALIQIDDATDLPVVELGKSDDLAVGEWVLAAGNPFGLSQTVTAGIVSALGRDETGIAEYGDFIQTDAAINPGNSGGPLLDIHGKVVGINTAIVTRSGGYMGIGFAIPINQAVAIKEQLIAHGYVSRSVMGVYIQNMDEELAASFGMKDMEGILISEIMENSAAEEAGLQGGDIIMAFKGVPVSRVGAFRNRVAATPPYSEVTLKIFREGDVQDIVVTTRPMDEPKITDKNPAASEMLVSIGMSVTGLDGEEAMALDVDVEEGVLITAVEEGLPAWRARLQPGQIITSVNRRAVSNQEEFYEALVNASDRSRVLFLISDGRSSRFAVVVFD